MAPFSTNTILAIFTVAASMIAITAGGGSGISAVGVHSPHGSYCGSYQGTFRAVSCLLTACSGELEQSSPLQLTPRDQSRAQADKNVCVAAQM